MSKYLPLVGVLLILVGFHLMPKAKAQTPYVSLPSWYPFPSLQLSLSPLTSYTPCFDYERIRQL